MNNVDLGTTRLADKLENAFVLDVYAAAQSALDTEIARQSLTKPLYANAPTYKEQTSSCTICEKLKGPLGILLGILFLVVFLGAR